MKAISIEKAFQKLNPESCVFVLSIDNDGNPNGMACSWHMKCSESPPLFAVALWKKGNTQKLIRKSKEFVVAIANKGLEKELAFFGSTNGAKVDKFKETKIKIAKSIKIKTPILKDATINFECSLYKTIDVGECYIFIGKILKAYMNSNKKVLFAFTDKKNKRSFIDVEN